MSTGGDQWHLPPRLRPQPLEVACGLTLGVDDEAPPLAVRRAGPPRVAFEEAIRGALTRPPCLVSFSGGCDSSVVLAVAAGIARREGLPLPVPTTYRFANAPKSEENAWQEQVVGHLGIADWERVVMTTEIDTVGPVAQAVLIRHGLLWPFNAHFHEPLLQRAAGGSLLTGIGGDELFDTHLWSAARSLLSGRRRRVPPRSVAVALAPRRARRWALARRPLVRWPWLRPGVEEEANNRMADWRSRTPLSWRGAMAWRWRSRYHTVLSASMGVLAEGTGATIVHPFMDPGVVGGVARHFGAAGPVDRAAGLRQLFGDVLPDAVLSRRTKAQFDEAFISDASRSFAAGWTGLGVDHALVDPDRLAEVWGSEHPDPRSLLLMQASWLRSR